MRKAADDVLARGKVILIVMRMKTSLCTCANMMSLKVRDENVTEQFGRMDKAQQEEMNKYERPFKFGIKLV